MKNQKNKKTILIDDVNFKNSKKFNPLMGHILDKNSELFKDAIKAFTFKNDKSIEVSVGFGRTYTISKNVRNF